MEVINTTSQNTNYIKLNKLRNVTQLKTKMLCDNSIIEVKFVQWIINFFQLKNLFLLQVVHVHRFFSSIFCYYEKCIRKLKNAFNLRSFQIA